MRKTRTIFLSLALGLVGGGVVCAEDFYVMSGARRNYAPIPRTGQKVSIGPRDDGALQKGVVWPTPRFTDNNNGTVTDNLTRLIWLKNADAFGWRTWTQALSDANSLASGIAGLTDGSQAGDWRLPNVHELLSLIDFGRFNPAITANHPFTQVESVSYWSSTPNTMYVQQYAWYVHFNMGNVSYSGMGSTHRVWCVRDAP